MYEWFLIVKHITMGIERSTTVYADSIGEVEEMAQYVLGREWQVISAMYKIPLFLRVMFFTGLIKRGSLT